MIRVSRSEYDNRLTFSFVSFTSQEIDILTDILHSYYGHNLPKYTYIDLSFIRESMKLDMLEGVIYVDNARIEKNLQRLFGGKKND